jgi:hypothetical protein
MESGYDDYNRNLKKRIARVFAEHPERRDERKEYPWIAGFLGNPFRGIWFVGENPSLRTVEKAAKHITVFTEENQWNVSKGDRLFRQALVKCGLKLGSVDSPGGWNCYITDIVKEIDYANSWHKQSWQNRCHVAETWLPVLRWEMDISRPKMVVAMGKQVQRLLDYLHIKGLALPHVEIVPHYSYIAFRQDAKRRLGPMDKQRVTEYLAEISRVTNLFHQLAAS